MAAFAFKAVNARGKNTNGVLEGDNARQVRQQLREKGLIPLEVEQVAERAQSEGKGLAFSLFKPRISASDLALLTRQLATLVESALPVEEALLAVAEQCEKPRQKNMMMAVRSKVVEGHGLADALGQFPSVFDELYRAMVAAGEKSGHLDTVLNRLADYTERRQQTRSQITQAMIYPSLMLFFAMGIVKTFLDADPDAGVIYFESESAITKELIISRGIDADRMVIFPVSTVQEFRHSVLKILDSYLAQNEADRKPLFLCLDSLGMLSTTKEMEDTALGKETRDMSRAQVLKAAFRVMTLKLGRAKVPMLVTNHTYDVIGSMFPQKEMGGGSGLKYAASTIVYLSRKKEKDGTEVIGHIIHCKNHKSRLTVENKIVDVRLTYDKGLDRYYGLLELGEKYGVFKKVSTRYELSDGTKQFGKTILNDPKTYFTDVVMEELECAANKEFKYGK